LEAEQAAAAEQAAQAEQHLARLAVEPVAGRDPAGMDPVAAARARLARELAARHAEIDAYAARLAAARGRGSRGRPVLDPWGGKRVKTALGALERASAKAATTNTAAGAASKVRVQRNLTDSDSRILPTRAGWVQGYNAQLFSADHLILAPELTNSLWVPTTSIPATGQAVLVDQPAEPLASLDTSASA